MFSWLFVFVALCFRSSLLLLHLSPLRFPARFAAGPGRCAPPLRFGHVSMLAFDTSLQRGSLPLCVGTRYQHASTWITDHYHSPPQLITPIPKLITPIPRRQKPPEAPPFRPPICAPFTSLPSSCYRAVAIGQSLALNFPSCWRSVRRPLLTSRHSPTAVGSAAAHRGHVHGDGPADFRACVPAGFSLGPAEILRAERR